MKITLNIAEDKELRNYIKDMIRGQIKSLAREEVQQIIKDEVGKKLKDKPSYWIDNEIRIAITESVHRTLRQQHNFEKWNDDFIKPFVDPIIKEYLRGKKLDDVINGLATKRLKELLDSSRDK